MNIKTITINGFTFNASGLSFRCAEVDSISIHVISDSGGTIVWGVNWAGCGTKPIVDTLHYGYALATAAIFAAQLNAAQHRVKWETVNSATR